MHDDRSRIRVSRRTVLAGSAGLALPAVLGRRAMAAERVIVATWGGDYAHLLHINVEEPILKPQGIEVVQDIGDQPTRFAKLMAQRHLPRGATDVDCFEAPSAYLAAAAGVVEKLDAAQIPNLKHVKPGLGSDAFVPNIYSAQVLIYNPKAVSSPPKTFTDLLDPKYKGKVGFPDPNFFYVMMAANLAASGNADDFAQGKKLLQKLNQNGLRLYPTTDSIAQAFRSGELIAGIMWRARVIMWQGAGVSVEGAFPTEGAILYVTGMVVPKNAPDKAGAYRYINAALDPGAQQGFAKRMGYTPTINDATLAPAVAAKLALPTPAPKLVPPNYAYTTKVQSEMTDWWQKNIESH